MSELKDTPEWLPLESVQYQYTCWSAREGLARREDGEANWNDDVTPEPGGTGEIVLCPDCADGLLTDRWDFSNGVRVFEHQIDEDSPINRQCLTPLAERPARFGDTCDTCADINWITVFVPELGGWVALKGYGSVDSDVWVSHKGELSEAVIDVLKDHLDIDFEENN